MRKQTRSTEFTKAMKKTHKIWLPDMLHYHNELLQAAFLSCGYQLEILPEYEKLPEYSLRYISSDYCYPTVLILGQVIALAQSGNCDVWRTAFMEPQTGGACRAGNIYNAMMECLAKIGFPQIPVISLNAFGEEKHPGFSITPKLLFGAVAAVCYGDLLMMLVQQTRPYEVTQGEAEECRRKWTTILSEDIKKGRNLSSKKRKERYREIVIDFGKIPRRERKLTKVGIAGEIYMKFSPVGNEHLEDFLQQRDCDYRLGGFINYAIYLVDSELEKEYAQSARKVYIRAYQVILRYLKKIQKDLYLSVSDEKSFKTDALFDEIKEYSGRIINSGCNVGDGWLIAGEVVDLISQGYDHILILHPFGCLVSHVCIRGIMKKLHQEFPEVNIQSIEYDYDSSKTLRESRILMGLGNF
ncbi:MAG: hypothetical protein HDR30_10770 [Lachnospiraceae bacterium]|nr:hypothetical protein [Lachnospiraceae bacterium]